MNAAEWVAIGLFLLGILTTGIAHLLAQKDKAQEKEISDLRDNLEKQTKILRDELIELRASSATSFNDLYTKHQTDADKLVDLQRELDKNHYPKNETDAKFQKLEETLTTSMKDIYNQLKEINALIISQYKGQIQQ